MLEINNMKVNRRRTTLISIIVLWLILMPVFLSATFPISLMRLLLTTIQTVGFLPILPLGLLSFFIDLHDLLRSNAPILIALPGLIVYSLAFGFYLWKCETFKKRTYIISYFTIMIIFVLSMKGCTNVVLSNIPSIK